jgi:uncharacterized protein YlxP (DUF503 family)
MAIGYCQIDLHIPDSHSLKEKRSVIRSIVARVGQQFNVSIAELDHQDIWQAASLGVVCIANGTARPHKLLEQVVRWMQINRPDVNVVNYQIEML